ncbi:fatty acid--CoA ligase family protein [Kitasatospora sp. NPDC048545]|uniref:ANL family adenylate-forming protein n=1 Tax=Kitasatospora sp. NPDC048545 TaxID=3157208 RepID=UPI003401B5A2
MPSKENYARRVLEALASDPDRIALWREGEEFTAGQFSKAVLTAAEILRRHFTEHRAPISEGKDPVVAVLTVTNTPATIIFRYAANLAGATLVHLHSTNAVDPTDQLAAAARQEMLSRTGATFLAIDKENVDAARELCDRLPEPPRLAALGPLGPDVLDLSSGDSYAFDLDAVEVDPEQPAVVICTSGTSGSPKAVTMPYRVRSLYLQVGPRVGFQSPEPIVYLSTLPVSNSSGTVVDLALASGGTVVLHDGFEAGEVLRAVEQHRISTLAITPPQLYMLVDHPDIATTDRSSIRNITYVGSPAAPARLAEAVEVFGPVLTQIYGTTETSPISILTPPDHSDPALCRTVGRPTAEVRIRGLDDDRDVPPGEIGEVCVRSPSTMLGYWGEPELTEVTIRDGWVHTGDLGSLDENGFLRLHGRMGEVMKTNGIKVRPTDVENALLTHQEVAQAAVYCVVDDDRVEHIHAAIVVRPGSTADSGTLIGHVAAELSPNHVPAVVTFYDALPLTGAGKPDKQTLVALAGALADKPLSYRM